MNSTTVCSNGLRNRRTLRDHDLVRARYFRVEHEANRVPCFTRITVRRGVPFHCDATSWLPLVEALAATAAFGAMKKYQFTRTIAAMP